MRRIRDLGRKNISITRPVDLEGIKVSLVTKQSIEDCQFLVAHNLSSYQISKSVRFLFKWEI